MSRANSEGSSPLPPFYRQDEFPSRPKRTRGRGSPRHVRLLTREDLDRLEVHPDVSIRLPSTILVEATSCGELLEAREYVGMPIREETRRRNLIACGATGAGKTYRFALPLLDATYRETDDAVVILNIKGPAGTEEIRRLAARHRPDEPFFVFSPGDADRSVAWNPVTFARRHDMMTPLVETVLGAEPRGSQDSAFWDSMARKVMSAALARSSMPSLAALFDTVNDLDALARFAGATRDPVLAEFMRFVRSGSHNAGTNLADITARLFPYARSPQIRAVLSSRNEFDMVALFSRPGPFTLVVEANESTFASDRPVLNLFFSMLFGSIVRASEANGGELAAPLSVVLDEFGAIGRIQDFETVANTSRSRRVAITAMVQTLAQITHHYGEAASSVMSAFNSKMFICSGLDLADREYASRLGGVITVESWRETEQYDPVEGRYQPSSRTQDFWRRPLLTPEDLAIPEHAIFGPLAMLTSPDHPPALLHLTAAWEIPHIASVLSRPHERHDAAPSSVVHEASERRLGLEAASKECRAWWRGFTSRMKRSPGVVRRVVYELETRDATIEDLHHAVTHSGTRSLRGNLLFLDLVRQAEREKRFGVPWALRPRPKRSAPGQPTLFTTCASCDLIRPSSAGPCPHCGFESGSGTDVPF
ncbi:MAG: type IV secretion system DNA-binding domain-containing protein [Phycisphaerales bacterium]|nr:type IV secretion system DNA-binding domain-containing protein [Phycisphaerales bacterium]